MRPLFRTAALLAALFLAASGASALDFSLKTLDGKPLSSKNLRGKVVLLDFWGTWCPPCVAALPSLRELSRDMKGEPFVLVSVAVEEDDGPVKQFVKRYQMDWPQVWDPNAAFARQFKVSRFPTYILLSHDGKVLNTVVGTNRGIERSLRAQVETAVAAAKKAGPPAGETTP